MTATTTTTLDALRDRLAHLRGEEYHAHQALLASEPCTFGHVRCHGEWMYVRGQIEEVMRQMKENNQ